MRWLREHGFWVERPLRPTGRRVLLALVSLVLLVDLVIQLTGQSPRENLELYLFESLVGVAIALFAWRPTVAAFGLLALVPVAHLVNDVPFMRLALPCALGLVTATCARGTAFLYGTVTLVWVLSTRPVEAGSAAVVGFAVVAGAVSAMLGWTYRRAGTREDELVREVAERERAIEEVRQAERVRIADEIHDGIARQLTVIAIQAKVLTQTQDEDVRAVSERAIADNAAGALGDLRRVLSLDGTVRTPGDSRTVDDWDSALADVTRQLAEGGAQVEGDVSDGPVLSPILTSTLVRVLREAAHNVRVHAPSCTRVTVRMRDEGGEIHLSVTNDRPIRRPVDDGLSGGYGLLRLTEVARMLGGTFTAGATPDGGWSVAVSLPRH